MKRLVNRNSFIAVSLIAVMLFIAFVVVLVYYVRGNATQCTVGNDTKMSPPDFLQTFNTRDGLDVRWYHFSGTVEDLEDGVKDNDMFTTAVTVRRDQQLYVGSSSETKALVPFTQWMDIILSSSGKGIEIKVQSLEETNLVLTALSSRENINNVPVWLSVKIKSLTNPFNFTSFLNAVKEKYPRAYVSVFWSPDERCSQCYSTTMVREMWNSLKGFNQKTIFQVPVDRAVNHWTNLRWLLGKSELLGLKIVQPITAEWDNATLYGLLTIRNDFNMSRLYYDFASKYILDEFKLLSTTAGTPLNQYNVDYDGRKITWAHAVNSREKLKKAIEENIMFLEADILLRGQGTPNQTTIPIMAHPPAIDSDITFEQWVDEVVKTDRGLKLDFKSMGAVEPSLLMLKQKRKSLKQPVWINADILIGPNSNGPPRNATEFLDIVLRIFPQTTLSLGWTTRWTNTPSDEIYSQAMVEEMHEICKTLQQPVTFPVRAAAARSSWSQFQWLLEQSRRYTVTIWTSSSDNVSREDMNYVYRHSEASRVYYDVPDDLLPDV